MKKALLFLLCLSLSLTVDAQSFTSHPGNAVTTYTSINEYTTATVKFRNATSDSIKFGWQLLEKTVPAGWDYSYCDYNTCYTAFDVNGIMTKVAAGDSGFVKVNVVATIEGWAHFKIRVFNFNNPTEADTVQFWFNGLAGTTETAPEQKLSIYPNPANNNGQLFIDHLPDNAKITILNSLGQQVFKTETTKSSLSLNPDWGKGVFFVRIISGDSQETRKIIVR